MLSLLIKLFIKDYQNVTDPKTREKYGILCGLTGICLNLLLFAGKFMTGLITNSISITADAFNNLSDAGSSLITLIGFKLAGKKPDPDHPFGHGRMEYLSGLLVSIAILLMGYELVKSSFAKILKPEVTSFNIYVVVILLVSISVKFYMNRYNTRIGSRINSQAMKATATDSLSDMVATSVVFLSALASYFFHLSIDGYTGLLVGIFILYAGYRAAKDTLGPLLGQAPTPEYVQQIEEIVLSYSTVLGIHDLIVHDYGPGRVMISLHAEVPATGDILELHDTIDLIEHQLSTQLDCSAVIHMDPVMSQDLETLKLKEQTAEIIHAIDPRIQFHDFRIIKGPTHTNVLFDIAVPYNMKLSDQDILRVINDEFHKLSEQYHTIIEIDKLYS